MRAFFVPRLSYSSIILFITGFAVCPCTWIDFFTFLHAFRIIFISYNRTWMCWVLLGASYLQSFIPEGSSMWSFSQKFHCRTGKPSMGVFLFLTYSSSCCFELFIFFYHLAEKDGGWVFWPYKCSREGFWSVFFVWHKFNSEVTCLSQLNSIFFFVCMCLCVLLACMCVVNMLPESRPRWLVAGCLGLALWWLTDLKGSTLFFGTYSSLKL